MPPERARASATACRWAWAWQPGTRNTLGLANLSTQRWFGWDGANDNLWAQSLRPLLDAREMGNSLAGLAHSGAQPGRFAAGYRRAFGAEPGDDDERIAVDLAKALAAYPGDSDHAAHALRRLPRRGAARRPRAAATYPAAAQRGLALFIGKGRCYVCHSGPNFSNGEFSDIGVPFFIAKDQVDAGRHGGIKSLLASRYNLLGPFNDDATRSSATPHAPCAAGAPPLR